MSHAIALIFIICTDVLLPAAIIWGWVRCTRRGYGPNIATRLSMVGLAFASTSAILAISAVIYAQSIGGFPFYDPRLLKIYRYGCLISLFGIAFSLGGIWKAGPLRWLSPICTFGTLLYWLGAASGE
jgi:hypothetical protein